MLGYFFLLFILVTCASLTNIYPNYRKFIAFSFSFFFVLFVGLRFDVGADYFSYKEIFEERYDVAEFGFNLLNRFAYVVGGEYWVLTMCVACMVTMCLHRVFSYYQNYYCSFFLYIVMSGGYAFMVNGIRQALAASFILLAISYTNDKKKILLFWVIATCFHLSSLVLFPFYWISKWRYPSKFCFYIFVFVFLTSFFINYGDCFVKILSYTYYSKYVLMLDAYRQIEENSTGLGFLFINLLGLMVLYKAQIILNRNPNLLPFIWAYFLFLILRILLADLPIFLRITIYFDYAMYIVIPCYLSICYKRWSRTFVGAILLLLLFILFAKSVSNDAFNLNYNSILFNTGN